MQCAEKLSVHGGTVACLQAVVETAADQGPLTQRAGVINANVVVLFWKTPRCYVNDLEACKMRNKRSFSGNC